MEFQIQYLLKVSAGQAIFYLFYLVFLKNSKDFKFNRFYLLFTIGVSFLLPLVSFRILHNTPFQVLAKHAAEASESVQYYTASTNLQQQIIPNFKKLILVIYVSIAVFLLLRLIYGYILVTIIIHRGKEQILHNNKVIITTKKVSPFTFVKKIVIPENILSSPDLENVIYHEKTHRRQFHFADLILSEMISLLLWFNPFYWLHKNAINTNLEYIADQSVINNSKNIVNYQMSMVRMAGGLKVSVLSNPLNINQLKNRIIMMTKTDQTKYPVLRKLAILPTLLLLVLLLSGKENSLNAQQKEDIPVKGKVTYKLTDMPAAGVIITIKGKNTGIITNALGEYEIRAEKGDVLNIYSTGYKADDIVVGDQKIYHITLLPDENFKLPEGVNINVNDLNKAQEEFTQDNSDAGDIWIIKGTVKSNKNDKILSGVFITVKDKKTGTITNIQGDYSIQINKNDVLVFAFPGYKKQTHRVRNQSELNVVLSEK